MKPLGDSIVEWSVEHPKTVTAVMAVFTLICATMIPLIKVDTDPENMLSAKEPVRIFHNKTKQTFDLSDMVVVGVINEKDPDGVFNPGTLKNVYELTKFAETLRWPDAKDSQKQIGVVEVDIIAPSKVDHIGQAGPGVVTFEWLMPSPPKTRPEALAVRDKILSNPLLKGTMVSEDGKALCIYLPLTSKDLSYRVYRELNKKIAALGGQEQYHITGLPVAEDTFGVEMFIQMAVSAPLAMLIIFLLMFLFFRKPALVISPMIVAMASVLSTMGLLIGLGYPVHIMSSMIPIFLMPIAVVDSVHILSEFFDRYTKEKGRRAAVVEVMHTLFVSMLYTSLTSAAGFLSLALTPIPPVQVFGIFVAVGVMIAWVITVTFVPAYVMLLPEKSLANFGLAVHHEDSQSLMTKLLAKAGRLTLAGAKPIIAGLIIITGIAIWGITKIQINDNPVKWFSKSHPIRVADTELNKHFGGTYMAYLVIDGVLPTEITKGYLNQLKTGLAGLEEELKEENAGAGRIISEAAGELDKKSGDVKTPVELLERMRVWTDEKSSAASDENFCVWDEINGYFGVEQQRLGVFKRPDVLEYLVALQEHLEKSGLVGKSNSVANVVMKVNQELMDGKAENYRVPVQLKGVAECLLQFQNSHDPQDLWHLVTPDFLHTNLWLQLKSGDNRDMEKVVKAVKNYFDSNPPPVFLEHHWAGLTYINTVWQDKMVFGMLQSFLGSFLVVFIMMAVLFRSVLWGLVCMIPLTITISVIYGVIGIAGRDYDMPVAVLSALTLGMAVDFAIHFLLRARSLYRSPGTWNQAAGEMFGEPARAITRNVLVIAIGFLPLLAAPLVPYKTVGIFLCAIMALSGLVTLLALPSLLKLFEKYLFKTVAQPVSAACNCGFCIVISLSAVILVALNLHQYWQMGITKLTWLSVGLVPVLVLACGLMSRREKCRASLKEDSEKKRGE